MKYLHEGPEPLWVDYDSLAFGDDLPPSRRHKVARGSCDGSNPNFTEAFDILGVRLAAEMARALGQDQRAASWELLERRWRQTYDGKFGPALDAGYGAYCVLWPCGLYPLHAGKAHDLFMPKLPRLEPIWWYFVSARAHQSLLSGGRQAGHRTVDYLLDQAGPWYVLDEGGDSAVGQWYHLNTTWNPTRAMPHLWAVSELFLLLRDCLLFEDEDRLVLLAGVPQEWFQDEKGIHLEEVPTYSGRISVDYRYRDGKGVIRLSGNMPPGGCVLALPPSVRKVTLPDGSAAPPCPGGVLLKDLKEALVEF